MNNLRHPEKINKQSNPIPKKPPWIRGKAPNSKVFNSTSTILKKNRLVTVCEEAACPNISECWQKKHATFMILGDICTRACAFCNIKTGKPGLIDLKEPQKIAEAVFDNSLEKLITLFAVPRILFIPPVILVMNLFKKLDTFEKKLFLHGSAKTISILLVIEN